MPSVALFNAFFTGMLDMNGAAGGLSLFESEDSKKEKEEGDMTMNVEEAEQ